jgi:hypothetical protein
MIGKSTDGLRHSRRTEEAGNEGINETPPNQGISTRGTLAAGRALVPHKITQSFKKEKLMPTMGRAA